MSFFIVFGLKSDCVSNLVHLSTPKFCIFAADATNHHSSRRAHCWQHEPTGTAKLFFWLYISEILPTVRKKFFFFFRVLFFSDANDGPGWLVRFRSYCNKMQADSLWRCRNLNQKSYRKSFCNECFRGLDEDGGWQSGDTVPLGEHHLGPTGMWTCWYLRSGFTNCFDSYIFFFFLNGALVQSCNVQKFIIKLGVFFHNIILGEICWNKLSCFETVPEGSTSLKSLPRAHEICKFQLSYSQRKHVFSSPRSFVCLLNNVKILYSYKNLACVMHCVLPGCIYSLGALTLLLGCFLSALIILRQGWNIERFGKRILLIDSRDEILPMLCNQVVK